MKNALIEAHCPELKGRCDRTARGEGGSAKVAVRNAVTDLFSQLKAKRVTVLKCTITVTERADAEIQRITENPDNGESD